MDSTQRSESAIWEVLMTLAALCAVGIVNVLVIEQLFGPGDHINPDVIDACDHRAWAAEGDPCPSLMQQAAKQRAEAGQRP